MQVVLASRNAGKLKELQTLLEPLAFSLETTVGRCWISTVPIL